MDELALDDYAIRFRSSPRNTRSKGILRDLRSVCRMPLPAQ
jgi:hypothetical protein